MSFRVRFTQDAQADLDSLYEFILKRDAGDTGDAGDWVVAERALDGIRNGITLLEISPFSCRKATAGNTFLRELVISFGASGYVSLFEIEDDKTVTILAVRHQREDDYH
jgi:plasmid stabilization system protein ParE